MSKPAPRAVLVLAAALVATPALALDLNGFRAAHHLPHVVRSNLLTALAAAHARDMARRNSLDHNGWFARARKAGDKATENVAMIPARART